YDASQPQIIRTEIMAPKRYTMRFIDRKQTHFGTSQAGAEFVVLKAFGRHVQEFDTSVDGLLQAASLLISRYRTVDHRCRQAQLIELIDLILHQRDERRNDQRQSWKRERR